MKKRLGCSTLYIGLAMTACIERIFGRTAGLYKDILMKDIR